MQPYNIGLWALVVILMAGATPAVSAQEKSEVFEPVLSEDLSLSLKGISPYAAAPEAEASASEAPVAAPAGKLPPFPPHGIEGSGGGTIVPLAYLVNPGPEGTVFGLPAASYTFLKAGEKIVQSFAFSETFYRRIEFSYALNHVGLGDWPAAVENATGVDLHHNYVEMHNLNLRGLLVEENSHDLPLPALAAGVHFKINDGVESIDNQLGGAASSLGYERASGVDYTLTSTKTIPKIVFGRPLIATTGLRFSQGAQLGWLGFGDTYRMTAEAVVVCPITDNFCVGYEYRQKKNPYHRLGNLVGREDDWHTVCFVWLINEHLSFAGVWGHLGNVVNGTENGAWGLQFKYEF